LIVDAPVHWTALDAHHLRGVFTDGNQSVSAELTFNAEHDLVNVVSEDRLRASADGKSFTSQGWSTPITGRRDADGRRVLAVFPNATCTTPAPFDRQRAGTRMVSRLGRRRP
jgi:hypothetical protein